MSSEMIKATTKIFSGFLLFYAVSCVAIEQKSGYSEHDTEVIVANQSTLATVIEKLGPPDSSTEKNGLIIFTYKKIERGSQGDFLPIPVPAEIFSSALVTETTLLIIEINADSKIVSSIERRSAD